MSISRQQLLSYNPKTRKFWEAYTTFRVSYSLATIPKIAKIRADAFYALINLPETYFNGELASIGILLMTEFLTYGAKSRKDENYAMAIILLIEESYSNLIHMNGLDSRIAYMI